MAGSLVALALALGAGCRKGGAGTTDAGPAGAPVASASASTAPIAVEAASPAQAWRDARGAEPLELARLADQEGPDALGEVARDDRASAEDRATAIRALMFVDDPTPAVETLGALAAEPSGERSLLALQTLAAVAPRRAPIEELEPGAWRAAGDALLKTLAVAVDPTRRELTLRVLRVLAGRGAVTPSTVPAR